MTDQQVYQPSHRMAKTYAVCPAVGASLSLYLALRAWLEKYDDDVRCIVSCAVPVCCRPICRKVVSAGAATAAGWSQGAACLDSYLRMISSRSATALVSLTLLTAVCRLASKPREFCPLAHPPLPESSCCVRLRGGGRCQVPLLRVKLVNIV